MPIVGFAGIFLEEGPQRDRHGGWILKELAKNWMDGVMTRWWQLKQFLNFHPENWGNDPNLTNTFSKGWFKFNHPLDDNVKMNSWTCDFSSLSATKYATDLDGFRMHQCCFRCQPKANGIQIEQLFHLFILSYGKCTFLVCCFLRKDVVSRFAHVKPSFVVGVW